MNPYEPGGPLGDESGSSFDGERLPEVPELVDASIPLDFLFATDAAEARARAEASGLESAVLGRLAGTRGFVPARQRRLLGMLRVLTAGAVFGLLLAAAGADRLGVAPWNRPSAPAGPVAGLLAAASAESVQPLSDIEAIGTGLRRELQREWPGRVVPMYTRSAETAAASDRTGATLRPAGASSAGSARPGPYFSPVQAGDYDLRARPTLIVFEDGLAVPAFRDLSPRSQHAQTLRWPEASSLALTLVSGDASGRDDHHSGGLLTPRWYGTATPDRGR